MNPPPDHPPPGCDVAEAWTRTDTQPYAATTLGAKLRATDNWFNFLWVFFAMGVLGLVAAVLGGPKELFDLLVYGAIALGFAWLVARGLADGGQRDTSEPLSWRATGELVRAAMRAPLWAGEREPAGERVRVRGRVRARTVIDGPEAGWCVAWERHTPDSDSIDQRTVERAGGVFDVVTDEGLTVRVDARHVAVLDGRARPQRAALHLDTWEAVIPDGALVDVAGALRREAPDGGGYRADAPVVMSGTEAEPMAVMWIDASAGATAVRVDPRAAEADVSAGEEPGAGGRTARPNTQRRSAPPSGSAPEE